MESNLDLVDRYGLPLVILTLIALRVWRFVRPFIRDTLQEHIQLIKELRDGTRGNTRSLNKQSDAMSAHAEALTLNTAFLCKIYDNMLTNRPVPKRPATLLVVEDSPSAYLLLRKRLQPLLAETGID